MTEIRDSSDYEDLLSDSKDRLIVIKAFASWCVPCRRYTPEFERAINSFNNIEAVSYNIESDEELTKTLGIQSIPATIFLKGGKVEKVLSGLKTEANLKEEIEQLK